MPELNSHISKQSMKKLSTLFQAALSSLLDIGVYFLKLHARREKGKCVFTLSCKDLKSALFPNARWE